MVHGDLTTLRSEFNNELDELVASKDWRKILSLSGTYSQEVWCDRLWCFPTECCLNYLKSIFDGFNITNVLSIGCGSGLLEWIMNESVGIEISGLEVDPVWWKIRKHFIPLNFLEIEQKITPEALLKSCSKSNWNFAVLFCYFNNQNVFNEYVRAYQGKYVIIIGPAENTNRYTEPLPHDPKFEGSGNYKLIHFSDFGDNRDHIAVFEKLVNKNEKLN